MLSSELAPGRYHYVAEAVHHVAQAGITTRVDEGGVLHYVPVNTPRFEGGQLVVEASGSNMLLRTSEFNDAYWTKSAAIASNTAIAPDGTTTADTVTISGAGQGVDATATVTPGGTYTASWFAQLGTLALADYRYAIYNASAGSFIEMDAVPAFEPKANGWARVKSTFSAPVGCTQVRIYPVRNSADVSGTLHLWGAQLELGEAASSHMPAMAAIASRAADKVYVRAGFPLGLTDSERRVVGGCWLVEMFFQQGVQRLTTWPLDLEWNGQTFRGLGELGAVGNLQESDSGSPEKATLTLSSVKVSLLSLALGQVETYRGRPVNIYYWPVDQTYCTVGDPLLRYFGVMDQVSVKRNENTGSITMTCMPGGVDSARRPTTLRMSHAQHQSRFPGDRGLEHIVGMINVPQVWISKSFFER